MLSLPENLRTWQPFKPAGGILRIFFDPLPGGGGGHRLSDLCAQVYGQLALLAYFTFMCSDL